MVPLRGAELGRLEQAGAADDAVERRAQLVAHVGEKRRLRGSCRAPRDVHRVGQPRGEGEVEIGEVEDDDLHDLDGPVYLVPVVRRHVREQQQIAQHREVAEEQHAPKARASHVGRA